jgi:nitrogen fixation protein FixH
MRIGWGWKIGVLYGCFVAMILTLVIASSHQHFDLVSSNYYDAEIGYQKVIDAGKNQSALSAPLAIHASDKTVTIDFPAEFKNKQLSGSVEFYAPVNAKWDRTFKINADNNSITIPRSELQNTRYTIKISCIADGKNFYQESDILLHL